MWKIVLLIASAIFLPSIESYSLEDPLAKLNKQVEGVVELIITIERTYEQDIYNRRLPSNYESTLRRAGSKLNAVTKVIEIILRKRCREKKQLFEDFLRKCFNRRTGSLGTGRPICDVPSLKALSEVLLGGIKNQMQVPRKHSRREQ